MKTKGEYCKQKGAEVYIVNAPVKGGWMTSWQVWVWVKQAVEAFIFVQRLVDLHYCLTYVYTHIHSYMGPNSHFLYRYAVGTISGNINQAFESNRRTDEDI